MAANKLHFETSLDGTGFSRGLNQISGSLQGLVAGAFSIAAITQAVRGTVDWASKLADTADNLQVNVEWLQKLGNAADLAGSNIQDVGLFIAQLTKARQAAINNPDGAQARAFGNLGISSSQISGLSTQAMMDEIARQFANGAGSLADLAAVGGRSARKLAEAFRTQFANDIPIVSEALVYEMDSLGDRFKLLSTSLKATLAPAIGYVLDKITYFVDYIKAAGAFLGGWAGGGVAAGVDAATQEFVKQAEARSQDDEKLEALKKRRAAQNNQAPNFSPMKEKADKAEKAAKAISPSSDALLAVGNFLGGGRSMINSIAEQQLTVARDQLSEQKITNGKLDMLNNAISNSGEGFEVP